MPKIKSNKHHTRRWKNMMPVTKLEPTFKIIFPPIETTALPFDAHIMLIHKSKI